MEFVFWLNLENSENFDNSICVTIWIITKEKSTSQKIAIASIKQDCIFVLSFIKDGL